MRFIDYLRKVGGHDGPFEVIFSIFGVFLGLFAGFVTMGELSFFLQDYFGTFLSVTIGIFLFFGVTVLLGCLCSFIGYIIDSKLK